IAVGAHGTEVTGLPSTRNSTDTPGTPQPACMAATGTISEYTLWSPAAKAEDCAHSVPFTYASTSVPEGSGAPSCNTAPWIAAGTRRNDAARSTTPAPAQFGVGPSGRGWAPSAISVINQSGGNNGFCASSSAASPPTSAAANEVPEA